LDAFVLENGQSLHDTLPPAMRNAQLEQAVHSGEGWKVPPIPAEAFRVNAQDRDWVNRQCTVEPLATFQQRLHLTGEIARIENVTFILATGWAPSPFPPFSDKARARGWRTVTMECGHGVMLDLTEELTRELLAVSARRSASAH
jgi:hypothetical protein